MNRSSCCQYPDEPVSTDHADVQWFEAGSRSQANGHATGTGETPFEMWKRTNVVASEAGRAMSPRSIKLFMGDLTAEQMLAHCRSCGSLLQWQHSDDDQSEHDHPMDTGVAHRGPLWRTWRHKGLADPGAELVEDIIACPGTDTCGLGDHVFKGTRAGFGGGIPGWSGPRRSEGCERQDQRLPQFLCAAPYRHDRIAWSREADWRACRAHSMNCILGGKVNGTAKIGQMMVKLPAKSRVGGDHALDRRLSA